MLKTEDLQFEGYTPFRNDRDNRGGGGIVIFVRTELKKICTIVEKGNDIGETLWVAIDNGKTKIRLGVIYAPQESRTSKEEYKTMYEQIKNQILLAREKQQKILLMGDFNCKIGSAIENNKSEVTKSGKLLLKMSNQEALTIMNTLDICDGVWTRTEGESRSVIDYILIDNDDIGAVKSMIVDEDKEFSPIGYTDKKPTFSDHNVLVAEFDWIVLQKAEAKKRTHKVVTNKGLANIRKEIEEKKVSQIFEKQGDIEEVFQEWRKTINEIWIKNTSIVKRKNPRKNIRRLIKIKRFLKKDIKRMNVVRRKEQVGRIKLIDEQIEEEKKVQFKKKIGKVVDKLRSTKGIIGPDVGSDEAAEEEK